MSLPLLLNDISKIKDDQEPDLEILKNLLLKISSYIDHFFIKKEWDIAEVFYQELLFSPRIDNDKIRLQRGGEQFLPVITARNLERIKSNSLKFLDNFFIRKLLIYVEEKSFSLYLNINAEQLQDYEDFNQQITKINRKLRFLQVTLKLDLIFETNYNLKLTLRALK